MDQTAIIKEIETLRIEIAELQGLLRDVPSLYRKQKHAQRAKAREEQDQEICPRTTPSMNSSSMYLYQKPLHNWRTGYPNETCSSCNVRRLKI